jgi:hypothetical protein
MKRTLIYFVICFALFAGSAKAQGTHTVALSWGASPDAAANPTLSYTVYRASGACSTSPLFAPVATNVAQTDIFTDTALAPGVYCYQVTAVLNGAESLPSNQVTARILPSAPTTLVAVPK